MARPAFARGAGETARKQPLHIGMADGSLFGLAGLYERWMSEGGDVLDTCTIVTTAANELIAPIHDRMPLIVGRDHYARWLDPANPTSAISSCRTRASAMAYYPVSHRVNSVRNDDASVLERVEPSAAESRLARTGAAARRSRSRCSERGPARGASRPDSRRQLPR